MTSITKTIDGDGFSVRPMRPEDYLYGGWDNRPVERISDFDYDDEKNISYILRAPKGQILLATGDEEIILIAQLLLGKGNCLLEKPTDDEKQILAEQGLRSFGPYDAFQTAEPMEDTLLTHAVMLYDKDDEWDDECECICALCSGELSTLLDGIEIGYGPNEWTRFLQTIPLIEE